MRIAPILVLCGVACASEVHGLDWRIDSALIETVEVSDNYFLRENPKGETFRTFSTVNLDILAKTPLAKFGAYSSFSYYQYLGSGADDIGTKFGKQNFVRLEGEHAGKHAADRISAVANWQRQDIASALIDQTGFVSSTGTAETFSFSSLISRQLTSRDVGTFSVSTTKSEFTTAGASPLTTFGAAGGWNHRVDPLTSVSVTASYDLSVRESTGSSETTSLRLLGGVRRELTKRLSLTANAGVGYFIVSEDGAAQPNLVGVPILGGGESVGFLGDATLRYRIFPTTTASVTVAQSTSPTLFGDLTQSTTIAVGLSHSVNSRSNLAFQAALSHFSAPDSQATDVLSASASYHHQLTREWTAQLTYSYRQRNGQTPATANTILGSVVRNFTILP